MVASAATVHLLVARNWKILRLAIQKASQYAETKLPVSVTRSIPEPVYARVASRQPIHPSAFLRQTKRWLSTSTLRRFGTTTQGVKSRPAFPTSRTGFAISQSSGRSPFASTLRPNLTGGVLPRTAGGYGLGSGRIGGARFFSHTPQAPAQVIQNVSQAIRAFYVGGKKAQYDGVDPRTGEKRFKAVSELHDKATKTLTSVPKASPGAFIDFSVNPTITALTPLSSVTGFSASTYKMEGLQTEGLLDVLTVDFSRALKELTGILGDLKKLTSLGDIPITYQNSSLRVHFPGCDAETVEKLADELGVQRGIIGQDPGFDAFVGTEIALLFPFAPSKTGSESSFYEKSVVYRSVNPQAGYAPTSLEEEEFTSPDFSVLSDAGLDYEYIAEESSPRLSSPSGYESMHSSEVFDSGQREAEANRHSPLEYQGIEGIYRFIEQCDNARR